MSNKGGKQNIVPDNSQQPEQKPSREELLQRLKMAKLRGGGIQRMAKKQRESTEEKLKTHMDEQQKTLIETLKGQMTPEQLAQMGIPNGSQVDFQTIEQTLKNSNNHTVIDAPDVSQATPENPISIPITLPKMSRVSKTE